MPYNARLFLSLHGSPRLQPIMRLKMRPAITSRRLWKLSSIACLVLLGTQALAGTALAQPAQPTLAPVQNADAPNAIPGQYIVVFKRDTSRQAVLAAHEKVEELGGTIVYTYTSALIGFSVKLPEGALQALRAIPGVDYIEVDQKTSIRTVQPPNPPGIPPTGLDRIDQRLLPLNQTYKYGETGNGVHVYVIDTGIRVTHTEFGGRASGAFTVIMDGKGSNDCHGHGTNVAGIVGASTYGVAKQVTLHAVRVLDCNKGGTVSGGVKGIDWVTANAILPAVANTSWGTEGSPSTSLDTAVTNSIAAGVTYVISAGNENSDACNVSPARVPTAITVGSVDPANDTRSGTSNFGTCLDLFAPGVSIKSTGIASDTATSVLTGTSQAAPHVAGVAARYLQKHPAAPPAVWAAIHASDNVSTTAGWAGVVNPGAGSPNELLHWGLRGYLIHGAVSSFLEDCQLPCLVFYTQPRRLPRPKPFEQAVLVRGGQIQGVRIEGSMVKELFVQPGSSVTFYSDEDEAPDIKLTETTQPVGFLGIEGALKPPGKAPIIIGLALRKRETSSELVGVAFSPTQLIEAEEKGRIENRPVGRTESPIAKPSLEVITGHVGENAVAPGETVQLAGRGHPAGSTVEIAIDDKTIEKAEVGQDGGFSATVEVAQQLGFHTITIIDQASKVIDGAMLVVRPKGKPP